MSLFNVRKKIKRPITNKLTDGSICVAHDKYPSSYANPTTKKYIAVRRLWRVDRWMDGREMKRVP